MICKFCQQPIYETETRIFTSWPHPERRITWDRGKWRHIKDDAWACVPEEINTVHPLYEHPHCHVCKVTMPPHESICSAAGPPWHHAMPPGPQLNHQGWVQEDDGSQTMKGWDGEKATVRAKAEKWEWTAEAENNKGSGDAPSIAEARHQAEDWLCQYAQRFI